MPDKRLMQQYTELMEEWTRAEAARRRVAERLETLEAPLTVDDPIWEEWDRADEVAGSAREAMRSFLGVNGHDWRPHPPVTSGTA